MKQDAVKQGVSKLIGAIVLVAALAAPAPAENINPYTGEVCQFTGVPNWGKLKGIADRNAARLEAKRIRGGGAAAYGANQENADFLRQQFPGSDFSYFTGNGAWAVNGMETYWFSNWEPYRWTQQDGLLRSEVSFLQSTWRSSVGDNYMLFQIDEQNPCNTRIIDARLPDAAQVSEQYLNTDITVDKNALIEALNRFYYEAAVPDLFSQRQDMNMPFYLSNLMTNPGEREAAFRRISELRIKH